MIHVQGSVPILQRAAMVGRIYKETFGGRPHITLFTDDASWKAWDAAARNGLELAGQPKPRDQKLADKQRKASLYTFGLDDRERSPFDAAVFYENLTLPSLPRMSDKYGPNYRRSADLWLKKILAFKHSPYEQTLFADADTCPCGAHAEEIFGHLRTHDVVNTIDDVYEKFINQRKADRRVTAMDVMKYNLPAGVDKSFRGRPPPVDFAERNCGFILYKKSPAGAGLIDLWLQTYLEQMARSPPVGAAGGMSGGVAGGDQPAYREAVYLAGKRLGLKEKLLPRAGSKAICRGFAPSRRKACQLPKYKEGKRGPGCEGGCYVVHEKCECWAPGREKLWMAG